MTVVISLGGSIIVPEKVDKVFLRKFRRIILDVTKTEKVVIVCGGGKICREYQNAAKDIAVVKDSDLDWLGIAATRLNAELVRSIFSDVAYEKVYGDPKKMAGTNKRVIVGAGYLPGHSSDMDAVQLAVTFRAKRVINMSNIDYVYEKDPRIFKDAKKIERISWKGFLRLIGKKWVPGKNVPFDPEASKEAMNAGLQVIILNGRNLKNLRKCIIGKNFVGTVIG
ncbi:MAG: UMP kinase [Candidatus Woesearchaeota archaeon]